MMRRPTASAAIARKPIASAPAASAPKAKGPRLRGRRSGGDQMARSSEWSSMGSRIPANRLWTFDAGTLPRRADKDQGMENSARTVARSMAHSAEVTARIAPMNTAEKRSPSERLVIVAVFACMPRPHKGEQPIVAWPGYAFVTFREMFFATGGNFSRPTPAEAAPHRNRDAKRQTEWSGDRQAGRR
jgi:hypothetical protein